VTDGEGTVTLKVVLTVEVSAAVLGAISRLCGGTVPAPRDEPLPQAIKDPSCFIVPGEWSANRQCLVKQ
jgi:hypothetical protein